jgi:hypothetical protein
MPTHAAVLDSIGGTVGTGWTWSEVAYDNVEPLDYTDVARPELSKGTSPYIGVKVIFADSYAAETGPNAIKRTWGYIETKFYTPKEQGARINAVNMGNMSTLFEYQVIDDIVFKELSVMTPYTEDGWYVTPTMLRFYFNR